MQTESPDSKPLFKKDKSVRAEIRGPCLAAVQLSICYIHRLQSKDVETLLMPIV